MKALSETSHPTEVVKEANKWGDNVGIISEEPIHKIIDYQFKNNFDLEFTSGTLGIEEALENLYYKIATDRHIYIGIESYHEKVAKENEWEYLSIQQAASEAGWELIHSEVTQNGDDKETTLDINEEKEDAEYDSYISVSTHRWHEINRGNKKWIVRAEGDELEGVSESDRILLYRGRVDSQQIDAEIECVNEYDDVGEIVTDVDHELIRPDSTADNIEDKIELSHSRDTDEHGYVAAKINTEK